MRIRYTQRILVWLGGKIQSGGLRQKYHCEMRIRDFATVFGILIAAGPLRKNTTNLGAVVEKSDVTRYGVWSQWVRQQLLKNWRGGGLLRRGCSDFLCLCCIIIAFVSFSGKRWVKFETKRFKQARRKVADLRMSL